MRYSISTYMHEIILSHLTNCKTIVDMGGVGKIKNINFEVTNANIRYGIDATKLPFKNNSFDASISVVVLEHVGNYHKQLNFIKESIRVAKKEVFHWIPVNNECEKFLKKIGHRHNCIIPNLDILNFFKFKIIDFITIREHLINLTMIHPNLSCKELYDYAFKHRGENYALLYHLKLGKNNE